jgi:hypothetical protein
MPGINPPLYETLFTMLPINRSQEYFLKSFNGVLDYNLYSEDTKGHHGNNLTIKMFTFLNSSDQPNTIHGNCCYGNKEPYARN